MPLSTTHGSLLLAALACLSAGCARPRVDPSPAAASAEPDPASLAVNEWLAHNAVRLQTADPGADPFDLEPLREIVGDARFVLMGEPTHGDRETVRLRHRMVRFLVAEMGFTAVALELPMAETFDVNRYVTTGAGTPEDALAATPVWVSDVESVADMARWIRGHNDDPATTRPVSLHGFDMQSPERAAQVTLDYLERVDPARARAARLSFGHLAIPFSDPDAGGYRPMEARDSDESVQRGVAAAETAFDAQKQSWSAVTGAEDWVLARQHARVLGQWVAANQDDGQLYNVMRDRGMAENLSWILEQGGPDARVVVWAHNIHLADFVSDEDTDPVPVAGYNLRRKYGDDVVIFSFHFDRGAFTALDSTDPSLGLSPFDVGPAPGATVEARFVDAGLEYAMVDLRNLPQDGPVTDWFAGPRPTRFSWGGYDRTAPEDHIDTYVFPEAFDVLAFVRTAVPTRMIEPADHGQVPVLNQPVNLDFEYGTVGAAPTGWFAWSKLRRLGFEIETSADGAAGGRRAARIHRAADEHQIGEVAGSLLQYIDAGPYRGRTVRIRASVRAEISADAIAYFRLRAVPSTTAEVHDSFESILDTLDKHRVSGPEWHDVEIVAEVPESAGTIVYGLFLAGSGTAWLDEVSVEALER